MSYYEIAKHLNISQQAVAKWYSGASMPNASNLLALSKLLNVEVETLLKDFLKRKKKYRSSHS